MDPLKKADDLQNSKTTIWRKVNLDESWYCVFSFKSLPCILKRDKDISVICFRCPCIWISIITYVIYYNITNNKVSIISNIL